MLVSAERVAKGESRPQAEREQINPSTANLHAHIKFSHVGCLWLWENTGELVAI